MNWLDAACITGDQQLEARKVWEEGCDTARVPTAILQVINLKVGRTVYNG